MITEIDHVQLAMPAGGEVLARAFYCDVLGFEETPKPEELAKRGGAATKAHPALRCDDYAALLKRLQAAAYRVVEDSVLFEGRPHCYVTDPFGNRIELIPE